MFLQGVEDDHTEDTAGNEFADAYSQCEIRQAAFKLINIG